MEGEPAEVVLGIEDRECQSSDGTTMTVKQILKPSLAIHPADRLLKSSATRACVLGQIPSNDTPHDQVGRKCFP